MILTKRNSCPCCNNKNSNILYTISYGNKKITSFLEKYYGIKIKDYLDELTNYDYTLLECNDCKTIFQKYIPNDDFSFKLYEEIISLENSFKKKQDLNLKNFQFYINEIYALHNLTKKKREDIKILEFGGGWGYWSRFIKSLNYNVFVNELSVTRKKFLKENCLNIIENINDSNETFDIIYSDQTFEHLNEPKEILFSLCKKLNKGGVIFLKFPNSFNFKKKLVESYTPCKDAAHPLEHVNIFSLKSFEKMIAGLNMQIMNIDYYYQLDNLKFLRILKNFYKFEKILLKKQ